MEDAQTPADPSERATKVRVWDLPTRVFHWSLVACVTGSVISAKIGGNAMPWHFRFGYAIFALLAFRIVWGLVGGRWSRFSSFAASAAGIGAYLQGRAGPKAGVGHNPLGVLSVVAMLALLAVQVGSGLFADDEIANSGPLVTLVSGATSSTLTSWHKTFGQWLVLGLVALHVSAILVYRWRMRQDLITPMVTGDKLLPAATAASADGWGSRLLAALLVLASAVLVAVVLQLGAVDRGG